MRSLMPAHGAFVFCAIVLFVSLPLVGAVSLSRAAESVTATPSSVSSSAPATRWEQALVTGNGRLGAMIFGHPTHERVVFNHEKFYEPLTDQPVAPPNVASAIPQLRKLLLAGNYVEARQFFAEAARAAGYEKLLWTDPYHPAMAMLIEQPAQGDFSEYQRSTNFATGEVAVRWANSQGSYLRRTFVSRPANVVVQQLVSTSGARVQGTLELVNQDSRPNEKQAASYQPPQVFVAPAELMYRCKYARSKRGYFAVTRVVAQAGETYVVDRKLRFDAEQLLMLTRLVSVEDWDAADTLVSEARAELAKLPADYATLVQPHAQWQREIFSRVTLDLGGGKLRDSSNEALLAAQKASPEKIVPALLERMFDMGRYSLLSSSGEWPPNLMGIFNGDWQPRWSGDFTLDANVNLQISAANIGNLTEATQSYTQLFTGLVDDWRVNARNLFGCRGVVSGTRSDGRHNLNTHHALSTRGFPGFFWTAGAQWLVSPLYEYYLVSGDREFAMQTLLPMMKEIVQFYEDFLVEQDANGKFIFVPSYSPENRPANSESPVVINATMDIACAKEALTNLIALCHDLDIEPDTVARCEQLLSKLPDYLVNDDGALQEWSWPGLQDRYDHRHVSHLYPLWPGHEINPQGTPKLFEAARIAAHKRGRGNGSAHGLAHMALIGTRLKDAELVYGNLLFMLRGDYILPSLFTYHNPNRIYNADMLHSLPAIVIEMLIYSKPGEIELVPALADSLTQGTLAGARCRGQIYLNRLTWDLAAKQVTVALTSQVNQSIQLRLRRGMQEIVTAKGQRLDIEQGTVATVELTKDMRLDLTITLVE